MRVIRIENMFMAGGRTAQEFPFIICGLAADAEMMPRIFTNCGNFAVAEFPAEVSPRQLDLLLARQLETLAGLCPLAGCTIRLPGIDGLSGGVLGNPASGPQDACGQAELVAGGWCLLTYPGGPGLACDADLSGFAGWLSDREGGSSDLLTDWAMYANERGARRFIALTDGSGPGADGAALIGYGAKVYLWRLAEV